MIAVARLDTVSATIQRSTKALEQKAGPLDAPLTQIIKNVATELTAARLDILRRIHPPISPTSLISLERLISRVTNLMSHLESRSGLSLPHTNPAPVDGGYELLGHASQYSAKAKHFFAPEVEVARLKRPTNEVSDEVDSISAPARLLKERIIEYLDAVLEALSALAVQ